jgi:hypothetical protein
VQRNATAPVNHNSTNILDPACSRTYWSQRDHNFGDNAVAFCGTCRPFFRSGPFTKRPIAQEVPEVPNPCASEPNFRATKKRSTCGRHRKEHKQHHNIHVSPTFVFKFVVCGRVQRRSISMCPSDTQSHSHIANTDIPACMIHFRVVPS